MATETPNKSLARSGRFRHPRRHDTLKNARPKFLVLFRKSTKEKPPRGRKRENGDITLQIYVNNIAHAYILRGTRHCSLHRPRVPRNSNALQSLTLYVRGIYYHCHIITFSTYGLPHLPRGSFTHSPTRIDYNRYIHDKSQPTH